MKFVGSSLDDLRDFPEEARRVAGFELRAVQNGLEPRDWKAMQSVGPGVKEIRIHVLGECFMSQKSPTPSIYFMPFRRRAGKQTGTMSSWPANGSRKLEVLYERAHN